MSDYYVNLANGRFKDSMERNLSLATFVEEMISNIKSPFYHRLMKASLLELVRIRDLFVVPGHRIIRAKGEVAKILNTSTAELHCQINAAFDQNDFKRLRHIGLCLAYGFDAMKPYLEVRQNNSDSDQNKKDKQAVDVRVISLPDRTTQSTIIRDEAGEIVNTFQVEKDAWKID